jgi:L-lactate dehydrogenase
MTSPAGAPAPPNRIAVIGAGAVGSTIAYATMVRGIARQIVLIDAQPHKAEAEAKDLTHGSMFAPAVEITSGPVEACAGACVVVITAGAKQKPGQTRLQLAEANVAMFRELIPQIVAAEPQALLLVVSNPVDVLTYVSLQVSGLAPGRVLGSGTVLDSSRFRSLLAHRLNVAVPNVHAYIVGEHGDSEVPLWSSVHIASIPLIHFKPPNAPLLTDEDRLEIFHNVRDAAQQVIAAKGATNWAIGLAVERILEAILRDEHAIFTVSSLLAGYKGIGDVCLSVPSIVGRSGVESLLSLPLSQLELEALRRSAGILRGTLRGLGF